MSTSPSYATRATGTPLSDVNVVDSTLRRRMRVPLIVVGVLLLAAAGAVLAVPEAKSSGTMLGATGPVNGGIARINGVIPMETDGWLPANPSTALTGSTREGTHRVRILLELTALDPDGLEYSAEDFTIDGWGSPASRLLWADPGSVIVAQGEVVTVTQVFEIPNRAIELALRVGENRFALGTAHHAR